jgi:hypothetical protein
VSAVRCDNFFINGGSAVFAMTPATAPPAPAVVLRTAVQPALFCACGQGIPAVAGLCRSCYQAQARSRARFAGHREGVLDRDGRVCRACGAGERRLHVHHRQPGLHDPAWLVTLCAACHARVHRLSAIRRWVPGPLVELWIEQHPGVAVQLQFFLPPALTPWAA